jgi:hypothetical protein
VNSEVLVLDFHAPVTDAEAISLAVRHGPAESSCPGSSMHDEDSRNWVSVVAAAGPGHGALAAQLLRESWQCCTGKFPTDQRRRVAPGAFAPPPDVAAAALPGPPAGKRDALDALPLPPPPPRPRPGTRRPSRERDELHDNYDGPRHSGDRRGPDFDRRQRRMDAPRSEGTAEREDGWAGRGRDRHDHGVRGGQRERDEWQPPHGMRTGDRERGGGSGGLSDTVLIKVGFLSHNQVSHHKWLSCQQAAAANAALWPVCMRLVQDDEWTSLAQAARCARTAGLVTQGFPEEWLQRDVHDFLSGAPLDTAYRCARARLAPHSAVKYVAAQ